MSSYMKGENKFLKTEYEKKSLTLVLVFDFFVFLQRKYPSLRKIFTSK